MSKNERKSRIAGRSAVTGQFVPLSKTKTQPATTVREQLPLPGNGTAGKKPKK